MESLFSQDLEDRTDRVDLVFRIDLTDRLFLLRRREKQKRRQ